MVLAGGLSPENVREAIEPFGPGRSTRARASRQSRGEGHERIRAYVEAARCLTYGHYGGRFVPETLIPALDELEAGWRDANDDPGFGDELDELGDYAGRPTPLTLAERFAPGKRLYLKREDLSTPARTS